jgi:hypothetical protein
MIGDDSAGKSRSAAAWIVAGITLAVFLPAVFNDFVDWDDVTFIVGNPRFNPPTLETVRYYWTHAGGILYIPGSFTLWAALARIGYIQTADAMGTRLNPYIFHLASVLLHLTSTMAVFGILLRLVGKSWPAAAGALLFAVHPLQVEPVAFIVGMNAPLAGAFALTAIWLYLRGERRSYLLATPLLVIALLCKPTAMITPALALLLDLAGGRRPVRAAVMRSLPLFVLVIPCIIWTKVFQSGAPAALAQPLWTRPLIAGDTLAFYLWKLLVPHPLGIDYGRTPQFVLEHFWSRLTWIFPAMLLTIAWLGRKRRPLMAAGAALYLIAMLPNAGLVSFDYQKFSTVADRYLYFSMLGAALMLAAVMAEFNRSMVWATVVAMLLVCIVLTEVQIRIWRNGETLFRNAIAVNPRSWMSYANLANIVADRAPNEAIEYCHRALAIEPDDAGSWNNLGSALMNEGESAAALDAFAHAHRLAPDNSVFSDNYQRAVRAAR